MTDDYTGEVTPGGVPAVRVLPGLTITKYAVDPKMANNCYLLECTTTGERGLIDAADSAEALLQLCDSTLSTLITTHQHWDHHRALAEVVGATDAETVAGAPDASEIEQATGTRIDRRVVDGDVIELGDIHLEVIAVAGHTPGSICLLYDDPTGIPHLFTGDSLFPGGPGRTTTPEEFDSIMSDLQAKVFVRLPDETWFYPGHGSDSTLGAERASIPDWLARRW